jgi:hypothetical protein
MITLSLIDLAELKGTVPTAFANILQGCIKYNRTSNNITNANGVSIFFPYGRLSGLTPMLQTYDEIGMDDSCSECRKTRTEG